MALFIRDPEVDELAEQVRALSKAPSKTDAVRRALVHEIQRLRASQSFDDRNAQVMAMADALGPTDPKFDQKRFTDEMWGG